jgi:uncharacterized protein with PIN domain
VSFRYIKASHLDASAAVKLVLQERGSEELRSYLANRASFYITSACLAEALGVFNVKGLATNFRRSSILRRAICVRGFKTVLITADRGLASAAKAEGLRVWNCEEEATPPAQ